MNVLLDVEKDLRAAKDGGSVPEEVVARALNKVTEILAAATATTVLSLDEAKELRLLARGVGNLATLVRLDKSVSRNS